MIARDRRTPDLPLGIRQALTIFLAASAASPVARTADPEVVLELSAYYTAVGLYVPLTDDGIPESLGGDELEVYRNLLLRSLDPGILLFEASFYPMPIAGTWIRRNQPGTYRDADLGDDINLVESVTAGLQEPAALSMFWGSAVNYVRPGEERRGTNKGHVGFLVSVGDRHIRENVLLDDDWVEGEWKIKGDRAFEGDELSWSFRVGTKLHRHPEIADTLYVGLQRGNLDWRAPFLAWLTNSQAEVLVALTADDYALARTEFLVEKRYPVADTGLALGLQLGVIIEKNRLYRGALRDQADEFVLVIRPNFEF